MIEANALRNGIHEQLRVLYALLLREIRTRFGHHRIGYAWALVEPAMHIGVLYWMRHLLGGVTPAHVPLLLWLITGVLPFFLFRSTVMRIVGAARGNSDILILPAVRVMDIIWARALLEFATYAAIMLFMLGLYAAIIGPVGIDDPLGVFFDMLYLSLLGIGFGMIANVVTSVFPSTQPLLGGILRVLYFISGALFSAALIPAELHEYLLWNPLLHVHESLHAHFFFAYEPMADAMDMRFVQHSTVIMLLLGMLLLKRFHMAVMEARP